MLEILETIILVVGCFLIIELLFTFLLGVLPDA